MPLFNKKDSHQKAPAMVITVKVNRSELDETIRESLGLDAINIEKNVRVLFSQKSNK